MLTATECTEDEKQKMRISLEQGKKINSLKLILAIMVVNTHATNYSIYSLQESNVGRAFEYIQHYMQNIYAVAVPFFFVISGYLFFYNIDERPINVKVKGRLKTLVLPYLVWSFLSWIYMAVISSIPVIKERINSTLNLDHFLWDIFIKCIPANHLWFIRNLFIITLIAPGVYWLLKLVRKSWFRVLVTVLIVIILYILSEWEFLDSGEFLLNGILYYAVGMIVGAFHGELPWGRNKLIGLGCLVLWLFLCAIQDVTTCLATLRNGLGIVGIWFVFDLLVIRERIEKHSFLLNISFFIYCLHYLVLETIEKIIWVLGSNSVEYAILDYFFAPIICLCLISLSAYIIRRFAPAIWSVLNGGSRRY